MTDDQINGAAVKMAGESTGDFVQGAQWALGEADPVRSGLWATIYAQAHAKGRIWFQCKQEADQAVRSYDRRA